MGSTLLTSERVVLRYEPLGGAQEIFGCREPEVLLSGPSGTGKSRVCLEKLHLAMCRHAGARGLMVRKTRASLTESAMITFERKVLHAMDGVVFHGQTQEYRYPNGSVIVVGGLDKITKIMSGEYDMIYVQEATELTENDWESLTTRLRNGVMPYQQLIGDCNPDAPMHWLKLRCDTGKTRMLESRHEDNPILWNRVDRTWTEMGANYMAKLDALTGVRFLRLRRGVWAAAEGMIYDGWDRNIHLIDRLPLPEDIDPKKLDRSGVPREWPRYWTVDFGYTNPFVWQAWCRDPDGRLYRYHEIYRSQRLVEDHAADMLATVGAVVKGHSVEWPPTAEPRPLAIICDHDAEDRATLDRHLRMATIGAKKAISPGIQAVASRLRPAGDGRPRLFLLRDALVSRDPWLADAKKPTCTEEEIDSYVWADKKTKEEPVDENNHGMDCKRYMVAHLDLIGEMQVGPDLWGDE